MSQNPRTQEFDVHDVNAVLNKFAQLRQALRQLDDDLTGLIYIAVTQVQKEQAEAQKQAREALEASAPVTTNSTEP